MINLAIDRGNSYIKSAVFDQNTLISSDCINSFDKKFFENIITRYNPDAAILSSVKDEEEITQFISSISRFIILDHNTPLPFNNMYKTPEKLGKDRLAGIAGAEQVYPESNILLIDAGTAVTYDILLNNKNYIGGDISPGLAMRFKALNQFTGKLPLVKKPYNSNFPGADTDNAVASGVINGMVFEISGYINMCKAKWDNLKIILTGGDANFFVKRLKSYIFVDSNLVLTGLNRILEYNA
ncbi:type III pantothenate kinase [Marinilabiliaceae bacterium ANBcel2]|nr:type III pantothenate kinase [Marinilabiliaceae bacterium ANBcel2]